MNEDSFVNGAVSKWLDTKILSPLFNGFNTERVANQLTVVIIYT